MDEPTDDAFDPSDDTIEIVLATEENTKNVGWFISDGPNAVEHQCNIPFYDCVKEGGNFEEADWKDQPCVRQARVSWRDNKSISWMERHLEMTQGFMLVGKAPALMVLGEPTHDRVALTEDERRWPDLNRAKGYIIPAGCGIILKKGTWHDFPISLGPAVTVFIINTREVVEALMSMEEPAPMDFGDCYKVRLADRYHGEKVRFRDPSPLVASLRLLDGINIDRRSSACTCGRSEGSITSIASSESTSDGENTVSFESPFGYCQGMMRTEVNEWGGPNANKVWVVPVINVESFVPNMLGPSVQPYLNRTQPELANRGWRDYGNRRGLGRLGTMFSRHGIPCTAVVSSDLVDNKEVMSLLHQFKDGDNWEIGGHGANNSNAGHAGLSKTEEASVISSSLETLGVELHGDEPKTWLTPGFSVTESTPSLLLEAGVETLLDFVDDDVPFKLVKEECLGQASQSDSLVCLPYSMETNDFSLVLERHLSPREYASALESHISQLAKESNESGTPRVVCLGMHTFVAGTPASVHELDKMFGRLKSRGSIAWATAQEVAKCVREGRIPPPNRSAVPSRAPLPKHVQPPETVQINCDRTGLLLVDFQNDFLAPDGFGAKLGNDPQKLRHVIDPTSEVLASARMAGLTVIHTREGHRSNLSDLTPLKAGDGTIIGSEGQNGPSMVRGQWGNEIIPELEPLQDETVIDKPGKGAFYQTDLSLVLKNSNIDTLIVCGVTTEICVHSTVREACDRGIKCIVLKDCTASYFDEFHRVGIEMIRAQNGLLGEVSDSKSIIEGLQKH
ncbi:hypothetical protein ACHAWF_014982 [Thalassiosira exigua]